jgi:hypothetical protein
MSDPLSRRTVITAAAAAMALSIAGCAQPAPEARVRHIGFALWAGVPGAVFGDAVDVTVGSRTSRGPIDWTHPVTGAAMQVYVRVNRESAGEKMQYFTLSPDGAALSRVFDSRPGRADRHFVGDAFFPLGDWTRGERRSWTMTEHENGAAREYVATIRIRRLSYGDAGRRDALRYDWILTDAAGGVIFDERYVYAPAIGFVSYRNRKG